MTAFLAGLVVGVAGSVHCVAMCGPLVAAVAPRGRRALIYHAGRGMIYAAFGAATGLVGAAFTAAGVGRWLAFAMAAVLAGQAIARLVASPVPAAAGWITRGVRRAAAPVGQWASAHPSGGALALGALNGLLPCGLLYGAAAAAAGLGSFAAAVAFMIGVAAGTTPLLAGGVAAAATLGARVPALGRVTPILLLVLALALVARGFQAPVRATHAHGHGAAHAPAAMAPAGHVTDR